MTTSAKNEPLATEPTLSMRPQRLMSLDALRGFDMFWIIGAAALVSALKRMSPNPLTSFLGYELGHAQWQGFHFCDLIFPLFIFITGVSLVLSLSKALDQTSRAAVVKRLCRRSLLLYAAGIFYYGGFDNEWPGIR